ncbi:MAG: hypothetical protein ISS78_12295, partial [Phycisphaerae bacterium]|nr:hypothetical protein [Phycisphaerae bacterium]
MKRQLMIRRLVAMVTGALVAGCGGGEKQDAASSAGTGAKTLYLLQTLKGHPVVQLTQIAHGEGCRKFGYECALVGTDGPDIAGAVA